MLGIILKTDYLYVLKDCGIVQEGEPEHLFQAEGYFKSFFSGENLYVSKGKVVS